MFSLLGDMISFPADLVKQARNHNTHCFSGVLEQCWDKMLYARTYM